MSEEMAHDRVECLQVSEAALNDREQMLPLLLAEAARALHVKGLEALKDILHRGLAAVASLSARYGGWRTRTL